MNQKTLTKILIIAIILSIGCIQETKQPKIITVQTENTYCDIQTPCTIGECILFPGKSYAQCYNGNPCNQCPTKKCNILETKPKQIQCIENTTTTTTTTTSTTTSTTTTSTSTTTTTNKATTTTTKSTTTSTTTTTTSTTTTTTTTTSTTTTTMPYRPPPCGSYGDVDGDGYVTDKDVEQLSTEMENTPLDRADVDGNGRIDAQDIALIIMYCNKQTDTFLACK